MDNVTQVLKQACGRTGYAAEDRSGVVKLWFSDPFRRVYLETNVALATPIEEEMRAIIGEGSVSHVF